MIPRSLSKRGTTEFATIANDLSKAEYTNSNADVIIVVEESLRSRHKDSQPTDLSTTEAQGVESVDKETRNDDEEHTFHASSSDGSSGADSGSDSESSQSTATRRTRHQRKVSLARGPPKESKYERADTTEMLERRSTRRKRKYSSERQRSLRGYETTIELPHDILTAYILIRINGTWDKLSRCAKFCFIFGFGFSWFAQFAVFGSLITETIDHFFDDFALDLKGQNFVANLVAICALFLYLWRDVMTHYNSVWSYINMVEKKNRTGFFLSGRRILGDAMKTMKDLDGARKLSSPPGSPSWGETAAKLISIGQFRVFLICTFVLYGGFALYSLVTIAVTEGMTDKLEVAINIFFVLEIDDWACELFVLSTGLIDEDDFHVDIVLADEKGHTKSVGRRLKWITFLLITSILSCYAVTYFNVFWH